MKEFDTKIFTPNNASKNIPRFKYQYDIIFCLLPDYPYKGFSLMRIYCQTCYTRYFPGSTLFFILFLLKDFIAQDSSIVINKLVPNIINEIINILLILSYVLIASYAS